MTDISKLQFSHPVAGLSMASGASPQALLIACASLLGGVAGPDADLRGPGGVRLARAGCNALVLGFDDGSWMAAEPLLIAPIESSVRSLRRSSQSIDPRLLDRAQAGVGGFAEASLQPAVIREKLDDRKADDEFAAHRGVQMLREPSFALNSPSPDTFAAGVDELTDGHALVYYPGGRFFSRMLDRKPERKWNEYLDLLGDALAGTDHEFKGRNIGASRVRGLRAMLYANANLRQLETALSSQSASLQRLIEQCWLIDPRWDALYPTSVKPHLIEGGCQRYWEAVEEIFVERRMGKGLSFKLTEENYQKLLVGINELESRLAATVPANYTSYIRSWRNLPYQITWTLFALYGDYEAAEAAIETALYLTEWVVSNHVQVLRGIVEAERNKRERQAREAMLAKLVNGPLSSRQLMRRFTVQRLEAHLPTLQALIHEGLILLDDQDRYCLARSSTTMTAACIPPA